MARPLSDERRNAILSAAASLIAEQGLGASTAEIAKRAGVPTGSVFTYFETKAVLLNALYIELKRELTESILKGMPGGDKKARLRHLWSVWLKWGKANPDKRKTLAQLSVSDQITEETRLLTMDVAAPMIALITEVRAKGALRDVTPRYIGALLEGMSAATIDTMAANPKEAAKLADAGFEAFWNMLS